MTMTARELVDILYGAALESDRDLEELYVTVDTGWGDVEIKDYIVYNPFKNDPVNEDKFSDEYYISFRTYL